MTNMLIFNIMKVMEAERVILMHLLGIPERDKKGP